MNTREKKKEKKRRDSIVYLKTYGMKKNIK